MIEVIVGCVLGSLCGVLATYGLLKKYMKPLEITEEIIDFIVTDTEMQKKVFLLGAILGNGIKSGIGINPRSGKFKWEDLIGLALQRFFLKGQKPQELVEGAMGKIAETT